MTSTGSRKFEANKKFNDYCKEIYLAMTKNMPLPGRHYTVILELVSLLVKESLKVLVSKSVLNIRSLPIFKGYRLLNEIKIF